VRRGIHRVEIPIPPGSRLLSGNRWVTLAGINPDLLFESKRPLHLHTAIGDLSFVVEQNFLILNPCGSDLLKSFPGARKTRLDRIIESLFGR
jgi:hypothetical protein